MAQEEPTAFPGRHTTLANREGHHKEYERNQVNSLIQEQTQKQETLVHIISTLNVTRYTTWVNRKKLNEVMDAVQKANEDMNILLNVTDVLMQHLRYHQIYTYAHTISAYLRDCLT